MEKLLRNWGLVKRRGSQKGWLPVFLQKSMFSLLLEYFFSCFFCLVNIHACYIINRAILSYGLLSTRK